MSNHKNSANRADLLTYKALQKAVELDKLRIYLDYGKINRPSSPVYNPWECLLPILIPIMIGLLLILSVGVIFGLMFIIAMIFVYSGFVKKKLYHKIIERTKAYLTSDIEHCQELWDFGGIVLVNSDNKKLGCVSSEGDWKEFVIKNFSDLMVDKQEEKKDEEVKL